MAIKVLPIVLPSDLYTRLESQARTQERDALQQARWLLKQAIRADALPSESVAPEAAQLNPSLAAVGPS